MLEKATEKEWPWGEEKRQRYMSSQAKERENSHYVQIPQRGI